MGPCLQYSWPQYQRCVPDGGIRLTRFGGDGFDGGGERDRGVFSSMIDEYSYLDL